MQDCFKILFSLGYKRFYHKEEILFFEGETPKQLFVLLSGKVRVYKTIEQSPKTRSRNAKNSQGTNFTPNLCAKFHC